MSNRTVKDSLTVQNYLQSEPHGQTISEKSKVYIAGLDDSLNKRIGWKQDNLHSYMSTFMQTGSVEVGWRECCGKTDITMHIHRAWKKVIAMLKKDGLQIHEERVKHGNRYATNNGGFWSSIIYSYCEPTRGAGHE